MTFTSGVINAYIYCNRNEHFRMRKPAFKSSPVCSSGNANDDHSAGQTRSQQNSILKNCIDPGFHRLLCVSILGLACDNFEHRLVIKPRLVKLICRQ